MVARETRPLWALTDHVCRCCFGRVLVRETFDHRRVYRCSNCGVEQEGRSEAAICACGLKLKTGVDAGIRCQRQEAPTPELPAEITAAQVEIPAAAKRQQSPMAAARSDRQGEMPW